MPGKKKASSYRIGLIKKFLLAASFAVVAYGFYALGFADNEYTRASLSKLSAQNQYRENKLQVLYGIVKAEAAGVKQDPNDLADYYARTLDPTLADKFKQEGPAALFCSNKLPDTMSFRPMGGNNNFVVDEDFYNGQGMEATSLHAIIEFSASKNYKESDKILDYNEKVAKVTCP